MLMEMYMEANGRMANDMAREQEIIPVELYMKENGRMANGVARA